MPENKKTYRLELTPEQRRRIAGVAAFYGMPQDFAIGVLATAAADRETMGDKDMQKILERAGKLYQARRRSRSAGAKQAAPAKG